jgi:hypothetical protein
LARGNAWQRLPAAKMSTMVWICNLLIPGAGLILRRREWLGFFLALMFGICANLAIAARLIAPDAIPRWMAILTGALSIALWIVAQIFLSRQNRWLALCRSGIRSLLVEARSAMDNSDLDLARVALESGMAIDDRDTELLYLYAHLCMLEKREDQARGAWEQILRLDALAAHRVEAREYLQRFSVSK